MYELNKNYSYNIGHVFRADDGSAYKVTGLLGKGGQGEVYRVSGEEGTLALKWYYQKKYLEKIDAKSFKNNLKDNISRGIPKLSRGDVATQFIWPKKMIGDSPKSFGYLMNVFPEGFESLKNVIMGRKKNISEGTVTKLKWKSWFVRVTAALNIVSAFEILHASGLSYQDINDGGFSINMNTGDVFICDCDNVSPDKTNLGILGIKTFMAPEVVRGDSLPDRHTDEYSIAIILFRLFFHGHPMVGQESHYMRSSLDLSDKEVDMMIYGTQPHYCLASKSNINPIDPDKDRDVFRLCLTYPMVLMNAFERVFTDGVNNPLDRLTATEWRKVLLSVRDHLVMINGKERFYGRRIDCELPKECRILKYKRGDEVFCMPGKILYSYHFDEFSSDYKHPVGKIIETTKDGVIGLYNASGKDIHFLLQGHHGICADKGRIPLFKGMELRIGRTIINVE